MTPLRREVHLPVYWLMVGMAVMLLSPMLSIFAAVRITEIRAQEASTQSRVVVCGWIAAFLDVYVETPPTTEAGRNLQARFIELYTISRCQPPRKVGTR